MADLPLHPTLLAIEAVDLNAVPVFLLDRSARRKVRAASARALFKQLGLKHISVTAPDYSMAQAVHVRLPRVKDVPALQAEWEQHSTEESRALLRRREYAAEQKVEAILARAFPNHLDRSDIMCDHFDYCWSVS